jgi:translation initiation factor 2 subunit 3
MATMLTGAKIMDAAILVVATNMPCPQPQTIEHLEVLELLKIENIIIVQNKIDLLKDDVNAAQKNYQQIKDFVRGTRAENSPIIPISAEMKVNIDVVLHSICHFIPDPKRDLVSAPEMMIVRSFDVNKPGQDSSKLKGGTILKGSLEKGDLVEIRPGIVTIDEDENIKCTPLKTKILSLQAGIVF